MNDEPGQMSAFHDFDDELLLANGTCKGLSTSSFVSSPALVVHITSTNDTYCTPISQGLTGAASNVFDYYVLAFFAPQCWTDPKFPEVNKRVTMHGFWPNYNGTHGTYGWPQYCRRENTNFAPCADRDYLGSQCNVSSSSIQRFSNDWAKYAPVYLESRHGLTHFLARHEWIKHGSCTNFSEVNYFSTELDLARAMIDGPEGEIISRNSGRKIALADLQRAWGFNTAFRCVNCVLTEIWSCRAKHTLAQTSCPASFVGNNCGQCDAVQIGPATGCNASLSTTTKANSKASCCWVEVGIATALGSLLLVAGVVSVACFVLSGRNFKGDNAGLLSSGD